LSILLRSANTAQTLSEDMYDDGYVDIVNIDFSPVVIEQMRVRNEARSSMVFQVMDMRELHFDNDSFDVVIDKARIEIG
jgi:hypothetical protein